MNSTLRFKVRPATAQDFDGVYALWRALAGALGPPLPGLLRQVCGEGKLLVAEAGGTLVGFLNGHVRRDGIATIYEVATNPLFRKQGVAEALVNKLMALSPAQHIRLKCITSSPANLFYKRLGFVVTATEKSTKSTLYLWEKKCTPAPPPK